MRIICQQLFSKKCVFAKSRNFELRKVLLSDIIEYRLGSGKDSRIMKKRIMKFIAGTLAAAMLMGTSAFAQELTPVSEVVFTTDGAEVYTLPQADAPIVTVCVEDLPVLATGVTDDGYTQVIIADVVYYMETADLKSATLAAAQTQQIKERLLACQAQYPEGMYWTNEDFTLYFWKTQYCYGYGCASFAFRLSDAAFGVDAPSTVHSDFTQLKVGDVVHCNNLSHFVVILDIQDDYVTVAEGNYNNSVHWGRTISMTRLMQGGSQIYTRY